MLTFENYREYDGLGLAALIRAKELMAAEALDVALAATDRLNPDLNAVAIDLREMAFQALKSMPEDGPFSGVPFLLKNQGGQVAGKPLTVGSRFFKDQKPSFDATLYERFRAAGFVTFGRSNAPEMSLTPVTEPKLYGATINPCAPDRITGGSSGGAVAAVAAGLVPVAHATDGGGSIRQPASCCGVFGLKPSRGRVSFGPGLGEGWNGLSTQHVVSRSVRDSAAALDAIDGFVNGDPYAAPAKKRPYLEEKNQKGRPLRILVSTDLGTGQPFDPICIDAVTMAADLCVDLGHEVVFEDQALEFDYLRTIIATVYASHTASLIEQQEAVLGRMATADDIEPVTAALSEHGKTITALEYIHAINLIHTLGRRHATMLTPYDVWLTSTMQIEPPKAGVQMARMRSVDDYIDTIIEMMPVTAFQNITGQPAMSVPLFQTPDGVPIGCHFTAQSGREDLLFRLAFQLEEACPWTGRYPKL